MNANTDVSSSSPDDDGDVWGHFRSFDFFRAARYFSDHPRPWVPVESPAITHATSAERSFDQALLQRLDEGGRTWRVDLDDLWACAHNADPDLAGSPDARRRLAEALVRLNDSFTIFWSKQYDAGFPLLPLQVRRSLGSVHESTSRTVPRAWLPDLSTVLSLGRLTATEIVDLNIVDSWLRYRATGSDPASLRERSFEMFADRKRLQTLLGRRLFLNGVVTLEMLNTYEVHPPFAYERIGQRGDILICEGHHTYETARRALMHSGHRGFAVIGYGAGAQFTETVSSARALNTGGDIYYFGDLSEAGLAIALKAAERCAGLGMVVKPAAALYRALSGTQYVERTLYWRRRVDFIAWLPSDLHEAVSDLALSGCLKPHEAVTAATFNSLDDWR